jgi:hypothetical protein
MTHAVRLSLAAAAALAVAAPAAAQQQPPRPQVGLGISITPNDAFTGVSETVELYVPILLAPQIRIEPSLGILSSNDGTDRRDFTLGIGGFWVAPVAGPVDMYAGGRLKLNFAHVSSAAGSDSSTDVSIAAALGGEYYLVPHFSLGLEGQLGYYSHGAVNGDTDGFYTTGLAFLRLYFR